MDDRSFDKILKNKLDNDKAMFDGDSWTKMESVLVSEKMFSMPVDDNTLDSMIATSLMSSKGISSKSNWKVMEERMAESSRQLNSILNFHIASTIITALIIVLFIQVWDRFQVQDYSQSDHMYGADSSVMVAKNTDTTKNIINSSPQADEVDIESNNVNRAKISLLSSVENGNSSTNVGVPTEHQKTQTTIDQRSTVHETLGDRQKYQSNIKATAVNFQNSFDNVSPVLVPLAIAPPLICYHTPSPTIDMSKSRVDSDPKGCLMGVLYVSSGWDLLVSPRDEVYDLPGYYRNMVGKRVGVGLCKKYERIVLSSILELEYMSYTPREIYEPLGEKIEIGLTNIKFLMSNFVFEMSYDIIQTNRYNVYLKAGLIPKVMLWSNYKIVNKNSELEILSQELSKHPLTRHSLIAQKDFQHGLVQGSTLTKDIFSLSGAVSGGIEWSLANSGIVFGEVGYRPNIYNSIGPNEDKVHSLVMIMGWKMPLACN